MVEELKVQFVGLDQTRDKISAASTACQTFLTANPTEVQMLTDTWSSVMEVSNQKVALVFLANDVIQHSRNDRLKHAFQICLPRALSVACSSQSAIHEIRKVLSVWDERNVYPQSLLNDWRRLVEKEERRNGRPDRSSGLIAISLAKQLKRVKEMQDSGATEGLHEARVALVNEIISVMKKVDHGHLDTCLHLKKINERLASLNS